MCNTTKTRIQAMIPTNPVIISLITLMRKFIHFCETSEVTQINDQTRVTIYCGHDTAQGYVQSIYFFIYSCQKKNWPFNYTDEVCFIIFTYFKKVYKTAQPTEVAGFFLSIICIAENTVHVVSTVLLFLSFLQLQLLQFFP